MLLTPLLLVTLTLTPAPRLADDVPPGADVVMRLQGAEVWDDLTSTYEELGPLLALWPALRAELTSLVPRLLLVRKQIQAATGTDVRAATSWTLVADLDPVEPLAVIVVRGLTTKAGAPPRGLEARQIEGEETFFFPEQDLGFLVLSDQLLLGTERGLGRQLRHRAAPPKAKPEGLALAAGRLRDTAPWALAALVPETKKRELLRKGGPMVGPFLAPLRALVASAEADALSVTLDADNARGQKALEHGLRSIGNLWYGAARLLAGTSDWGLGLTSAGGRLPLLPQGVGDSALTSLSRWLREVRIDTTVSLRKQNRVEARYAVSDPRAFAFVVLGVVGLWGPSSRHDSRVLAERLLFVLREAERAYKKKNGKYLSCAVVPAEVPQSPVIFPDDSCFAALGFRPEEPVRFQLSATGDGDKLVLMARTDSDADGIPEIYYLDDDAPLVRTLGAP